MKANRCQQISTASAAANTFGLVLSTLGRQGSISVLENLKKKITEANKQYVLVLMSEIFPQKLKLFADIDGYWLAQIDRQYSIEHLQKNFSFEGGFK
jgi:2-(3-amino-3-carboxypropyl)histidine synthase